jgi:sec-independent protein translocase protein TatA
MPTLHWPELTVILVIVLLIFGVGRVPEIGKALGKGIREFRKGSAVVDGTDKGAKPKSRASKKT